MVHYTNTKNPIDFPKPALNKAKGDLLALAREGKFDAIVHGCNCMCTMGSGIARQVREQYPEAYRVDQDTLHADIFKLGMWTCVDVDQESTTGGFRIYNAYTQFDFNRSGNPHSDVFEYHAFGLVLRKLSYYYGNMRFGFPYIGMGLAGGDSTRIIAMLEAFAEEVSAKGGSVTLVEYQP